MSYSFFRDGQYTANSKSNSNELSPGANPTLHSRLFPNHNQIFILITSHGPQALTTKIVLWRSFIYASLPSLEEFHIDSLLTAGTHHSRWRWHQQWKRFDSWSSSQTSSKSIFVILGIKLQIDSLDIHIQSGQCTMY